MSSELIVGLSTHFIWRGRGLNINLTGGRVYKITNWRQNYYSFFDDCGEYVTWIGQSGVEDCSFEVNLKKVLE